MFKKISLITMGAAFLLGTAMPAFSAESMVLKAHQGTRFNQYGTPRIFGAIFLHRQGW